MKPALLHMAWCLKYLKRGGLIAALEQICIDYSTSRDIIFKFSCHNIKEGDIGKDIKINVFRLSQEISTNIVRHSLAKEAKIELSKNKMNILKLIIKDNGIGIDFKKVKKNNKGAGLKNIERRVTLLKGTVDLKSELDKGTQFTIKIPLDII